ncbi:hypothetical protein ACHAWF_015792 [Thalassiosira exigua]
MSLISVKVLFFASAREAAGNIASASVVLGSDEGTDTGALRAKLATLYPKLAPLVRDEENLTLALNEEYVPPGEVLGLKEGDVVALIPPISGG